MLSLDSPRWRELQHAYGSASDIPDLLRQLDSFPSSSSSKEPWFSIWSALAHQGDVYSASFAAVPHVIRFLSIAPAKAPEDYFHFPTWVEICRHRKNISVPSDLLHEYTEALARMPKLVCTANGGHWSDSFSLCALSAIAVGKNSPEVAAAILELTPDVLGEFQNWLASR
jgi:hypothetical protein